MASEPTRRDPAGTVQPETRDETIERIVQEEGLGAEAQHQPQGADPTERRHVGTRGLGWSHLAGVVAAVAVFLIVLALGGGIGLALALGGALLIGVGVVVGLGVAMREDGRIERDVERVADERPSSS